MSSILQARFRATFIVVCLPLLSPSSLWASDDEELVVLLNGRIIRGMVTPLGDEMIVAFAEGGEMRIPTATVECRCRTLVEAYQLKRQRLNVSQPDKRLDLAEWCIQNKLLKQAMHELLEAQVQDPGNERIDRVRRQWLLATQFKEAPAKVAKKEAKPQVGVEELDKLVRNLPAGAVERFTSVIQPILVNGCATSNCHGATASSDFRLIRPASRRILARRFTQRNLYATLQMIDRVTPEKSPLLVNSIQAHGTQKKAPLGTYERHQYEDLVNWVRSVTKRSRPQAPLRIAKRDTRVLQTSTPPARGTASPAKTQAARRNETDPQPAQSPNSSNFKPTDPFDPEIFNRRFHDKPGRKP